MSNSSTIRSSNQHLRSFNFSNRKSLAAGALGAWHCWTNLFATKDLWSCFRLGNSALLLWSHQWKQVPRFAPWTKGICPKHRCLKRPSVLQSMIFCLVSTNRRQKVCQIYTIQAQTRDHDEGISNMIPKIWIGRNCDSFLQEKSWIIFGFVVQRTLIWPYHRRCFLLPVPQFLTNDWMTWLQDRFKFWQKW